MDYSDFINQYQLDRRKNLESNIADFYRQTGTLTTYRHCLDVAKQAITLDNWFKTDLYTAGLLHDISAFIPPNTRLKVAESLNIPILDEERACPMLLHQKLSAYIAQNCFHINDRKLIKAIECHTTLRGNFTAFDLELFLADKIAWDQAGTPPYLTELTSKLPESQEAAALLYINYIISHNIQTLHPWLREARRSLTKIVRKK